MNITNEQLEASQAIYTKQTLALYDLTWCMAFQADLLGNARLKGF